MTRRTPIGLQLQRLRRTVAALERSCSRTIADELEIILAHERKPLRVRELVRRLRKKGFPNSNANSVHVAIARSGSRFRRVAHGTYALGGKR